MRFYPSYVNICKISGTIFIQMFKINNKLMNNVISEPALISTKPKLLQHTALTDLLKRAYSAEKAAAFAYQGHAASVTDKEQKAAIHQIEQDEWNHRREVLRIMDQYKIRPSKFYEIKYHIIGRVIGFSCHII